jgi:hypothetical protein
MPIEYREDPRRTRMGTETPDPNNAAAAIFGAVKRLDIDLVHALAPWQRSSGHSGMSTANHAASTNSVVLRRVPT